MATIVALRIAVRVAAYPCPMTPARAWTEGAAARLTRYLVVLINQEGGHQPAPMGILPYTLVAASLPRTLAHDVRGDGLSAVGFVELGAELRRELSRAVIVAGLV